MGKTKLAVVTFASPLHAESALSESHQPLFAALRREFDLVPARPGEEVAADLSVVFIASGGVEAKFRAAAAKLARPLLILADGKHNSLAAALEIMGWLKRRAAGSRLLHGDPSRVCAQLRELVLFDRARRALACRIGVVGRPSDWLIGSVVDARSARRNWGTRFCRIRIDELIRLAAAVSPEASAAAAGRLVPAARDVAVAEPEIVSAARLYPAIKELMARHRLDAVTVRCFSLLERLKTTACMAASLLCDEGALCGCEGDAAALFSMLVAHRLTGEAPFMANPSRIDADSGEIVLAHCTVPARATAGYAIRSHFESGIGVGIAGELPLGPATLFKVGGPGLGEFFVGSGELLEHPVDECMCRTQARIRLDAEAVDYFFRAPLANHHVLVRGDHAGLIRRFMEYAGSARPV